MKKKSDENSTDKNTINDRNLKAFPVLIALGLVLLVLFVAYDSTIALGVTAVSILAFSQGFFINDPNEARVIEFFGHYIGTYFKSGICVTLPFSNKHVVSLKFQNINTEKIKVNDANGSPIEISVVIVWRVSSPAKAYYNVNNYHEFVFVQSDSVIRELASNYPYDSESDEESLRKNSDRISNELRSMLQQRLNIAGIEIAEARISHLAYSSEIAQAMLRRQQAHAITSARKHIVQNAIGIIEEVIAHFEKNKSLQLDGKQKVQLINNLLVALISEQDAQPTISLDNN
ncbi:putative Band 7 family membrane protein [Wolbachia endosymbiont of Armadillidium vulgare str. wVulC]|uniref:SPFH domain-containing protein n=1 Tax=Wolbachia endosymbiont of Armadillidium vulgare TaxID=77039 RepID=UPI00064B65F9|nr:SPFH domain-containing protein [Wolbachia endosymbiont of Armadillidium vulgare]KLT22908.1 putative Band 7 family membrane protein [Wolbachia endosymbiont of Armadillidium vulgare str. wVulC]OJH31617.1 SPFH domain / Band 7 family protein [Wolbachia endosymbiont of Armadillidium vulgare]OJH32026.1 SPFH domain / Band 7 family protein [Wolbachia endosymbiont of Armadillidium vulgare]OJH32583.1 SPFH domain / Band 7 family protein [Wolbachia endosymbiont of Armadillidium vulgare]OJH33205.1 SPFH 